MTACATVREYVARLQTGEVVPRPDSEEWAALITRISVTNRIAEIDEDTWNYFLECLPPKFMSGSLFAFAEGAEPFRLFWTRQGGFFVRPLTWQETQEFCRLAKIPLPR